MTIHSTFFHNQETAQLLARLHQLCFSKPWDEEAFSKLLAGHGIVCQILQRDETPVGFCLYQIVEDEAEILTLGIIPNARRRSNGLTLLLQGENYLSAKKVSRLFLEVSSANSAAVTLYGKCGFQEIGFRKNYYSEKNNKFDAIVMSKLLCKVNL